MLCYLHSSWSLVSTYSVLHFTFHFTQCLLVYLVFTGLLSVINSFFIIIFHLSPLYSLLPLLSLILFYLLLANLLLNRVFLFLSSYLGFIHLSFFSFLLNHIIYLFYIYFSYSLHLNYALSDFVHLFYILFQLHFRLY